MLVNVLLMPQSTPLHGRIAPTPSGFLHRGNAFSFVLTWLLVRLSNGTLTLRIDDIDKTRKRPEYVEDIFQTLDWLGLDWDKGAQNPLNFEQYHSQHLKLDVYQKYLIQLIEREAVFACTCSRSQIRKRSKKLYDGFCMDNTLYNQNSMVQKNTALRINTNLEQQPIQVQIITGQQISVDLNAEIPFFVIQKKDKLPTYQLVSLIDDIEMNINCIVRGQDLLASTAAQLFLADLLGQERFTTHTKFLHHSLVLDKQHKKLSKSAGSVSMKYFREQGGTRADFLAGFCAWIGLQPHQHFETLPQLFSFLKDA